MTDDSQYCSTLAQLSGETLLGTAKENSFHFVMMQPKITWLPKVEQMAGRVGAFAAAVQGLPQVKFTLTPAQPGEEGLLWLFPHCFRFDGILEEEFPELVAQVLRGQITLPYDDFSSQTIILACTHGKRDLCCALHGTPVLQALQQQASPSTLVMESSHLGGHRFAATLIVYPAGQWYGQLSPADVPALLAAIEGETVLLPRYRGNAAYPPPLQTAEAWGYEELQRRGVRGYVELVNPELQGRSARVEVSMNIDGQSDTKILHLSAEAHTFVPNSNNPATEERLVWQVARIEDLTL